MKFAYARNEMTSATDMGSGQSKSPWILDCCSFRWPFPTTKPSMLISSTANLLFVNLNWMFFPFARVRKSETCLTCLSKISSSVSPSNAGVEMFASSIKMEQKGSFVVESRNDPNVLSMSF